MLDIKNCIDKNKAFLLYGEEQYYLNRIVDYLNRAYDKKDITRYDGCCLSLPLLHDDIRQRSFFSPQRVFIINNLQASKTIEKPEAIEGISKILKDIDDDSKIFFFYRKKLLRTSPLVKLFAGYYMYESKALTEGQTIEYIETICQERNIKLSPDAIGVLYNLLGNDVNNISSALAGLQGAYIDTDYILENVSYSKTFNAFELMAAIAKRDKRKIQHMTTRLLDNMSLSEIIPLIGLLYSFFTKVLILKTCERQEKNSMLYITAAKNYSTYDIIEIITIIKTVDERVKGL